ncbi:hypothetical protein [Nitratidesulfovibrio liaohensis]|uniref:Uncharacterized protein n=1 Tax=Nitratidesulfovibrio liaohensis TaxID=2604158 RepID=A0ABY9R2J0_9BACT|nr:hypothetical protein [Nitratidesulfovibrio liaohensis]WMW65407.1 hypothetical protein KPS_003533 [Nitratidesulfovibrio liaohensis]
MPITSHCSDVSGGADRAPDPRARRIADAILRWLASGVRLDAPACTFLEAQLGVSGLAGLCAMEVAARLASLLGAESEVQAASLSPVTPDYPDTPDTPGAAAEVALEYLLYPDTALRVSVERLLATQADEDAPGASDPGAPSARLADAVLAVLPPDATAVLHVPDVSGVSEDLSNLPHTAHAPHGLNTSGTPGPGAMPGSVRRILPVPSWAMAQLVRRLRLDRVIPAPMAAAVAEHLPEQQALAVRLALRDARFDLTEAAPAPLVASTGSSLGPARESRPDLVLRFIRRMPPSDPGYIETLALWLDLLHDLPPGKSAHAALSARRERLARAAREADEFTERLGRLNMEILMLQGVHAPALDAAEARRRVRLMDRMCLAVLGRPAALDPAEDGMAPRTPDGHDLGAFDPATGLDDLMRLLS